MTDIFTDRIFALIDIALGNLITKNIDIFKFNKLKSNLINNIQKQFLDKYGNEEYYSLLDKFIENSNIFYNAIRNF
jgi:hypothetical protein